MPKIIFPYGNYLQIPKLFYYFYFCPVSFVISRWYTHARDSRFKLSIIIKDIDRDILKEFQIFNSNYISFYIYWNIIQSDIFFFFNIITKYHHVTTDIVDSSKNGFKYILLRLFEIVIYNLLIILFIIYSTV